MPRDYAAWSHVASCESGGWQVLGAAYPDPVGITAHNWAWIGAEPLPAGPLSMAQRLYVIKVADRFIRRLGIGIPDPGSSCAAW
ncbi:MAG: hypothetical protein KGL39_46495 [Patescibacteria group bacterium]|nr:hypothetical protein [Patescibacteria group bacterium]